MTIDGGSSFGARGLCIAAIEPLVCRAALVHRYPGPLDCGLDSTHPALNSWDPPSRAENRPASLVFPRFEKDYNFDNLLCFHHLRMRIRCLDIHILR